LKAHLKAKNKSKIFILTLFFIIIPPLSIFFIGRLPKSGLIVTYYDNPAWSGKPVLVQHEKQIDLTTYENAQAQAQLPLTNFSITWTGWMRIDADSDYHVMTISDDGSSVFIDEKLVVDNGGFHGKQQEETEVFLTKGMHKITINYFNGPGSYSFSFHTARDAQKGPDQRLSSDIFFPHPLAKDMEIFTRYPGVLHLGVFISIGLGILTWKYDKNILEYILNLPLITWVVIGFLFVYLLFFIRPVFLNVSHEMQFFKPIPAMDPIGADLRLMLKRAEAWFIKKQSPYIIGENQKPPLASVLFTPLIFVDAPTAYAIITLISLLCYLFITLILPLLLNKEKRLHPVILLLFISGLFSYGFQFELERGQFNVLAISLCFGSIYIYHYYHRYRYVAYVLFSISIQLKLFPAIFIVMFVRDWRDWKNNIKRACALAMCNFLALFALGPQAFLEFITEVKKHVVSPDNWIGNHSIRSFVTGVLTRAIEKYQLHDWAWVSQHPGLVEDTLLAFVAICLFLLMFQAYRQEWTGINPYLLLACTIGALLIPSVSHDYKLSILTAPVAIMFSDESFSKKVSNTRWRPLFILLICMLSFAYSSTLFSYTHKSFILTNNFPALIAMLGAATVLSLVFKSKHPDMKENAYRE